MTTVTKTAQRGLVAAVVMVLLILVFFSLADDAQAAIVNIPCGQDIDATINADPRSTPSTFELGAGCTFTASATIVPSNGDVVKCERPPDLKPLGEAVDPTKTPVDPTTYCTVAGAASVDNVFRPIGQGGGTATVRFEGIKITGGNFTGSSGTGTAIAEGSMTNDSYHYGIEVMDNDAAGIVSAKGTFDSVEFTNNTRDPGALGFIGAAMKARDEVEVRNSYVHDTQGNGLWCDQGCADSASHPNGFWVHDNLVVNNGRAGIRLENGANPKALIENNRVHGNSPDAVRGGISVRDSQNAIIQGNHFGGETIAGVAYPPNSNNVAIIASDSGGADRTNLSNILIVNNDLSGEKATEIIKGCELPDGIVDCSNPEQPISRTDATAPTVISTVPGAPGADATGVDPTTNVTATFSEDMQSATVVSAFKLTRKGSTTKLPATVSYSASTDMATLDPRDALQGGVTYKAVVTTGAKDLAGNPLEQQHRWFFTVR